MPGVTKKIWPEKDKATKDKVSFRLLLISHGFASEVDFIESYCRKVIPLLFKKIDPFKFAKRKIEVWAHYIPSGFIDNILEEKIDGLTYIKEPDVLIDYLKNLKPNERPAGFSLSFATELLLFGGSSVESSGICIVTNSSTKPSVVPFNVARYIKYLDDTELFKGVIQFLKNPDIIVLEQCVVMTSWPTEPTSEPKYKTDESTYYAAAGQMAQAIGLMLGLAPEAEYGNFIEGYLVYKVNAHNLTHGPKPSDPVKNWKWNKYLPEFPARTFSDPINHPDMNKVNDNDHKKLDGEVITVRNLTKDKIIRLKQWDGNVKPLFTSLSSGPNCVRYAMWPLNRLSVGNIGVNMIEGGLGQRTGLYRPATECIMRYSGSEYKKETDTKYIRVPKEFCPVCRKYITDKIMGIGNYAFNAPYIDKGNTNTKLGEKLVKFIKDKDDKNKKVEEKLYDLRHPDRGGPQGGTKICVEATTRRISKFFETLAYNLTIKQKKIPGWKSWQNAGFRMPGISVDAIELLQIWVTYPKVFLNNFKLSRFVGTGVPGALEYAGFGKIVNDFDQAKSNALGIPVYQNLSLDQIKKLKSGSVLQLWRPSAYDWLIRYAGGWRIKDKTQRITLEDLGGVKPDTFMSKNKLAGHSLIYLGVIKDGDRTDLKNHKVADQNKPSDPITEAYSLADWEAYKAKPFNKKPAEGFTFKIAMEWYKIKNLNEVK